MDNPWIILIVILLVLVLILLVVGRRGSGPL